MDWLVIQHGMLRVIAVWALLNLSAVTGLAALFFAENLWFAKLRRRARRGGTPVIPISRR
jgi:hypothetical protein